MLDSTYNRADPRTRILLLDLLRAFALLAILLTHGHDQFGFDVNPPIDSQPDWLNTLNEWVDWFIRHFLAGKAVLLFSFLFGIGFFIQLDRAEARGKDFRWRFAWRLMILLMIGVLNTVFYDADILSIFALQGLLLIPFYRANSVLIVSIALLCILGIPTLVYLMKWTKEVNFLCEYTWEQQGALRADILMDGNFWDVAQWNFLFGQSGKWKYFIESGRIGQSYGMFLLGLLIGQKRIFEQLHTYRHAILKCLVISLPIWLALWVSTEYQGWEILLPLNHLVYVITFMCVMTLCYLTIAHQPLMRPMILLMTSVGKMTLTAYISQSIIFSFLLYGWGLCLAPHISYFYSTMAGLAFFILQAFACSYWLRHYQYGPLEWIWRTATYTHMQPFRKKS